MAKIGQQVIILSLCTIISICSGENVDDTQINKVEEDTSDAASRNARYIKYQGNPYYYQNTGGYFYPNRDRDYYYPDRVNVINQYPGGTTQFYPVDRHPSKFDPNYWLSKLPGFSGNHPTNYYPGNYPNPSYPNYYPDRYPGTGTNFIGYDPHPSRYPSRYPQGSYPQGSYPQGSYPSGYPQTGYPGGYSGHGNGGYGGYGGNGGLTSYSGYDGYYAAGNRPGNVGFGYHNSRTNGVVGGGRYPTNLIPIATPSTVPKDAK